MDSGSQGQGAETGVPPQDPSFPCLAAQRSTHERGHQGLECGTCNLILGRLSGARFTTPRCYKGRLSSSAFHSFIITKLKRSPSRETTRLWHRYGAAPGRLRGFSAYTSPPARWFLLAEQAGLLGSYHARLRGVSIPDMQVWAAHLP